MTDIIISQGKVGSVVKVGLLNVIIFDTYTCIFDTYNESC